MAVEDEEPLTHKDQSEEKGEARHSGGPASIETILTSALHKRAAKKLGKVCHCLAILRYLLYSLIINK